MHLDDHVARQRLLRLKYRARAHATRELSRSKGGKRVASLSVVEPVEAPAPDAEADEAITLDRRQSARRSLERAELIMRRIGGFNFQVPLVDVSVGGCRIVLIEECVTGEDVIARFPQLEPLGGLVRWTEGTTAGVEFARPIHPAVFAMLLSRMESGDASAA